MISSVGKDPFSGCVLTFPESLLLLCCSSCRWILNSRNQGHSLQQHSQHSTLLTADIQASKWLSQILVNLLQLKKLNSFFSLIVNVQQRRVTGTNCFSQQASSVTSEMAAMYTPNSEKQYTTSWNCSWNQRSRGTV